MYTYLRIRIRDDDGMRGAGVWLRVTVPARRRRAPDFGGLSVKPWWGGLTTQVLEDEYNTLMEDHDILCKEVIPLSIF